MKVKKITEWIDTNKPQFKFKLIRTKTSVIRLKDNRIFSTHDLELPDEKRVCPPYTIYVNGLNAIVVIVGWISKFNLNCIHANLYLQLLVIIDEVGHGITLLHSNPTIEINDLEETINNFKEDAIEYLVDKLEMVNGMGAKEK